MNKQKPIFGLSKIPHNEYVKFLQMELGKAYAYICELEEIAGNPQKYIASYKGNIKGLTNKVEVLEKELYEKNYEIARLRDVLTGNSKEALQSLTATRTSLRV
ncbi:hypothetical protein JGH11_16030 [Dysgonomonas sp. Marseille-P4677]|uniref:hypothetical protein n=1 Tax=Dysgonomonas sp. Marseille-P4677 TaxID=2364790 RepID=UPI001913C914|nr:hypothetical protein [Dysgonomonas sp. Marseille-P4677]MBK5722385.1 hypothetical protein [Dysgonomonas sp. Marseille-P4677]